MLRWPEEQISMARATAFSRACIVLLSLLVALAAAASDVRSAAETLLTISNEDILLISKAGKLQKAYELVGNNAYLDADLKTFRRFVLNGPREYTTIIFITSTSSPCPACQAIEPQFERIAQTYRSIYQGPSHDNPLLFVRAEISKLQEVFPILTSKFMEVPQLIRLPPTSKSNTQFEFGKSDMLPITQDNLGAAAISEFIRRTSQVDIPIFDLPWQIIFISLAITSAVIVVVKFVPNPFNHLNNPKLYLVLSFILCAANFGGTPYNLINNPPFIYADPYSGRVMWFLRSARAQLKFEGWLMGLCVPAWAMTLVGINEWALKLKSPSHQRLATSFLVSVLVGISLLVHHVFKQKYGFYPY